MSRRAIELEEFQFAQSKQRKLRPLSEKTQKALTLIAIDKLNYAQAAREVGMTPEGVSKACQTTRGKAEIQRLQKEWARYVSPEHIQELKDLKEAALKEAKSKIDKGSGRLSEMMAAAKAADEMIKEEEALIDAALEGEQAKEVVAVLDKLSPETKERIMRELDGIRPKPPDIQEATAATGNDDESSKKAISAGDSTK